MERSNPKKGGYYWYLRPTYAVARDAAQFGPHGAARAMLGWSHAMEKFGVAMVSTSNASGVLKRFTDLFGFREWCSCASAGERNSAPSQSLPTI